MSNQHNHNSDSDSPISDALATAGGVVTDLLTGATIPAPIRRNAWKAFGHLCTAALDIPVSHLEGIAAEKRAETQERIKLISTTGDQIAAQMDVEPDYARAAVRKFGQKVIREQINLDKVAEAAADQIRQDTVNSGDENEAEEVPPINEDWLNNFEKEASQKSTEEMQLLFGRILAGEIQRPSSFSIKTVRLLSSLDSEVAQIFKLLCSLRITSQIGDHIRDSRVVSLGKSASLNSLRSYGLGFGQLSLLEENGLIISQYDSQMHYENFVADGSRSMVLSFLYQNKDRIFIPLPNWQTSDKLWLSGVALSHSGRELMKIVDTEEDKKYTDALQEYFKSLNLEMVECRMQ